MVSSTKYYFDKLKIKQWVTGLDLGHSQLFIFIFVKSFSKSKWTGLLLQQVLGPKTESESEQSQGPLSPVAYLIYARLSIIITSLPPIGQI